MFRTEIEAKREHEETRLADISIDMGRYKREAANCEVSCNMTVSGVSCGWLCSNSKILTQAKGVPGSSYLRIIALIIYIVGSKFGCPYNSTP